MEQKKVCPLMTDGHRMRYCNSACALIVDEFDYDDEGNVRNHWTRCAFKDMLFDFSSIANSADLIARKLYTMREG